MVGESMRCICTALEGSLQYVRRLAEGIPTNNNGARPTSNSATMAPSTSNHHDEEQLSNGNNSKVVVSELTENTPANCKKKRCPKVPYTPDQ